MSEKLKVTYLLPDFDEHAYSGGLYVIFQQCNGLIGRGHDVRVFNNTGKKSKYLRLDCPVGLHKNDPSNVEAASPDIIVGSYWHTYFFIGRMKEIVKNNTKLCLLVQGDDRSIYPKEDIGFIYRAMTGKYRNSIPVHKIVVSRYLKEMMRKDFGEDSFYVKNGFEPREVSPLLPKSGKVRIAARYDPSAFRGWDVVDKVLYRVAKIRKDIEIHLFEMKKKAPTRYRSVFHKGLTGDELLKLFKSCDIYVSGSRYEGFGYPAIEAMSQGACVCCTDSGGNREFCIDGETALISTRDDADGLERNLIRLLDNAELRDRIRKKGIDKARQFPWKESLDRLEEALISLASQPHKDIFLQAVTKKRAAEPGGKGRALFICGKDPFSTPEDWDNLEEKIGDLRCRGFSVTPLVFTDIRPAKSVRARLKMLAPPEWLPSFKYKVFYNKRFKFRMPFLSRLLFMMSSIMELARGYTHLIALEVPGRPLRLLCKMMGINFYEIKTLDKGSFADKIG